MKVENAGVHTQARAVTPSYWPIQLTGKLPIGQAEVVKNFCASIKPLVFLVFERCIHKNAVTALFTVYNALAKVRKDTK